MVVTGPPTLYQIISLLLQHTRAHTHTHTHRYLYYVDFHNIFRCHLDGSHKQLVYSTSAFSIHGLCVDVMNNMLYWTNDFIDLDGGRIEYMSIAEWEALESLDNVSCVGVCVRGWH